MTCVVDGDTVWIAGEKIRLKDVDAAQTAGACKDERLKAVEAGARLIELLAPGNYPSTGPATTNTVARLP